MLLDELLTYLFDGQAHLLAAPMATWLSSSRRFTAFVTTFRAKIRKKLRATQEIESLLDLRLELETAYLLLQERSLSLVYEPPPSGQLRGPDFAVTFTTSTLFMVEVTRLRMVHESTHGPSQAQEPALTSQRAPLEDRLADMVCGKLGQLLPQHTNILLISVEAPGLTQDALRAAMRSLQQRAERNDAMVVQRHRFRDRADFFHHYQRLSELLVRGPHLHQGETVIGWVNPQARYPLPSKVRTALYRSHSG
ncbi:MAG TPA: hypothetical protein VFZ66_03375 [Herpetosiphonaceae bacterium]